MIVLDSKKADTGEEFTSLIWIRQAVRALDEAGIITCSDALALEREMVAHAEENDLATGLGGPFTIHVSTNSS